MAAPERIGPFPDEAAAEAATKEMDERYADFLNIHLGYFEAQELGGEWFAVRVLGSESEHPSSVQWLAGLGP